MTWYLAKIVYRIVCGSGNHKPQFDEQLRLVHAASQTEAYTKACNIGHHESETFYNEKQQLVQWQFINVSELHPLECLIDGAELYSRITETDNGEAYEAAVHQRAQQLKQTAFTQQFNYL